MYKTVEHGIQLSMDTKAYKALQAMAEAKLMTTVDQLLHEGAFWFDEGTEVALMVNRKAVIVIYFDENRNAEDFEECFDIESYVRYGG
jgi:hypothetical protein